MQSDQQFISDNLESLDDMLNSAKAVKGKQFSETAFMTFQSAQLMQLAGILAHEAGQDELSEVVFYSMNRILVGTIRIIGEGLSDSDFTEACELGEAMMERKLLIESRLQQGLN